MNHQQFGKNWIPKEGSIICTGQYDLHAKQVNEVPEARHVTFLSIETFFIPDLCHNFVLGSVHLSIMTLIFKGAMKVMPGQFLILADPLN